MAVSFNNAAVPLGNAEISAAQVSGGSFSSEHRFAEKDLQSAFQGLKDIRLANVRQMLPGREPSAAESELETPINISNIICLLLEKKHLQSFGAEQLNEVHRYAADLALKIDRFLLQEISRNIAASSLEDEQIMGLKLRQGDFSALGPNDLIYLMHLSEKARLLAGSAYLEQCKKEGHVSLEEELTNKNNQPSIWGRAFRKFKN